MAFYTCEICDKKYSTLRDLNAHLLEHIREDSLIERERRDVIEKKEPDAFDVVEKQMAQQLRLMQMQEMIRTLKNPMQQGQQTGMSDMFKIIKEFGSLRSDLKQEILAELETQPEGEDSMIKDILSMLAMQKGASIPQQQLENQPTPEQLAFMEQQNVKYTTDAAPPEAAKEIKKKSRSKN